jgi:hypothetical protein
MEAAVKKPLFTLVVTHAERIQKRLGRAIMVANGTVLPYVFWLGRRTSACKVLWLGCSGEEPTEFSIKSCDTHQSTAQWYGEFIKNGVKAVPSGDKSGALIPSEMPGPVPCDGKLVAVQFGNIWLYTIVPEQLAEECNPVKKKY